MERSNPDLPEPQTNKKCYRNHHFTKYTVQEGLDCFAIITLRLSLLCASARNDDQGLKIAGQKERGAFLEMNALLTSHYSLLTTHY
jgi:hypothetical protein